MNSPAGHAGRERFAGRGAREYVRGWLTDHRSLTGTTRTCSLASASKGRFERQSAFRLRRQHKTGLVGHRASFACVGSPVLGATRGRSAPGRTLARCRQAGHLHEAVVIDWVNSPLCAAESGSVPDHPVAVEPADRALDNPGPSREPSHLFDPKRPPLRRPIELAILLRNDKNHADAPLTYRGPPA